MSEAFSQDPQPLALPVRPQGEECFDSWIGRLAAVHDVTLPELFGHLAIDNGLAQIDLGQGRRGVPRALGLCFDQMIVRLAWAVSIDAARIRAMFVKVDKRHLLPPGLRRYVCPVCSFARKRAGQPIIVKREWTLRLSWRCHEHRVPLIDLRRPERLRLPAARWLERAGEVMARFEATQDYDEDMIARNRKALTQLLGPSPGSLSRLNAEYIANFAEHKWHLAASRTLLLASAHGRDPAFLERHQRFERQLAEFHPLAKPSLEFDVVTLPALAGAIWRIHSELARRAPERLARIANRLRAKPAAILKAQRRLDKAYARFRAAWDRQTRVRALRERRKVLTADREVMLGRITLECWEGRSTSASLLYLRKALAYRRAALAHNRNGFPHPIVRPEAWGLGIPNNSHLLAMIGDLEQAIAASEKGKL